MHEFQNLDNADIDDAVAELADILEMGHEDLDDEDSMMILRKLGDRIKGTTNTNDPESSSDTEKLPMKKTRKRLNVSNSPSSNSSNLTTEVYLCYLRCSSNSHTPCFIFVL